MQLYCPPYQAEYVLVIDPVRNVTDNNTLGPEGGGFGYTQTWKWSGIAFCGLTNKVSFSHGTVVYVRTVYHIDT